MKEKDYKHRKKHRRQQRDTVLKINVTCITISLLKVSSYKAHNNIRLNSDFHSE